MRAYSAPPPESEMAAYLRVYFKDDTHGLHFTLSSDGYTFTDVMTGRPLSSPLRAAKRLLVACVASLAASGSAPPVLPDCQQDPASPGPRSSFRLLPCAPLSHSP